jgi:hypothetical protein
MPPVQKRFIATYNAPHLAGALNLNGLVFNPSDIQVPGDVDPMGDQVNLVGGRSIQLGKLRVQIGVTYPDGHVLTFPINSQVVIQKQDGNVERVYLNTDNQGFPVPVPVPAAQQGARRRSTRRRSAKRRSTRRLRQ